MITRLMFVKTLLESFPKGFDLLSRDYMSLKACKFTYCCHTNQMSVLKT